MTITMTDRQLVGYQIPPDYRRMPLLVLTELIFKNGDTIALRELHSNRPLFRHKGNERLLMADYLVRLKQCSCTHKWCGNDSMILENAYDLALAKFLNMPSESDNSVEGPDCRYYYKAFHAYATDKLEQQSLKHGLKVEFMAAESLQRMVQRHFNLSCLECRRQGRKLVRRYAWKLNGSTLYVWLPTDMPGRRCQTWLRCNVSDVDPKRPGERDRVQAIVNRLVAQKGIFSLDELERRGEQLPSKSDSIPAMLEEEITINGLVRTVAQEKADNIEYQRPAIRTLGKARLIKLVSRIFDDLVGGEHRAEDIAADFEISKATFSRFAGSRWTNGHNNTVTSAVPDLWRNVAHVLAGHQSFITAARGAGVWKQVCRVLSVEAEREAL